LLSPLRGFEFFSPNLFGLTPAAICYRRFATELRNFKKRQRGRSGKMGRTEHSLSLALRVSLQRLFPRLNCEPTLPIDRPLLDWNDCFME
jgi:hypothetical protein